MEADFGGWATKAGLKCSDGRTIMPNAFQHMDGKKVPLVFQHGHSDIENVLGYMQLEHRSDGVYAHGYFNDTAKGQAAKVMVQHGDIKSLSIYANQLVEKTKQVVHGMIREVSLVLAGANPGAVIDFVRIAHGEGEYTDLEDEAVIHTGLSIEHADDGEPTLQEAYDKLPEDAKNVVHALVEAALEAKSAEHSDESEDKKDDDANGDDENKDSEEDDADDGDDSDDDDNEGNLDHQEGADGMPRNVFEQNGTEKGAQNVLSHDDMKGIVADAVKGGSLKEAVEAYAVKHGIESIETLFPDPKTLNNTPEFNQRRVEWVNGVWNGTRKSPFSRVKSIVADLTQEEARAKGYIKGSYKKEEWFGLTSRVTTPTTVYKKQQLDRDDIVDITDFDVVAWLKAEMRMMLMEELARAILIGDGRDPGDSDKIKDPGSAPEGAGIRAVVNENELYATTVNVNVDDADSDFNEVIESVLRARRHYKGSGTPTFYTTDAVLTEMLLVKDGMNRRMYNSEAELASALRVSSIVPVEVMEDETDLVGIIVNLADYNVGADKGGEVNLFDDFDIDYNQYKYLIETRISGALTKIKSALVIKKVGATSVLVQPTTPTFNKGTGVVTIPTKTGVVYQNADTSAVLTAGAQTALDAGITLNVLAVADTGYYFADNASDEWSFTRPAA